MEQHYSQDDLDEMSKETVSYNGKDYSRYKGEQQLRHIERTIRGYKKEAATQDAMGIDNTAARCKIGEWQAKARDFTEQTGIRRDRAREYIGMPNGEKQPKALPSAAKGYADNLKKAQEIKRLDNARNKTIAETPQGKPMNFRQADGGAPNPNYRKGGGYATNCQTCTVAYELRRRGFNVEALVITTAQCRKCYHTIRALHGLTETPAKTQATLSLPRTPQNRLLHILKTSLKKSIGIQ